MIEAGGRGHSPSPWGQLRQQPISKWTLGEISLRKKKINFSTRVLKRSPEIADRWVRGTSFPNESKISSRKCEAGEKPRFISWEKSERMGKTNFPDTRTGHGTRLGELVSLRRRLPIRGKSESDSWIFCSLWETFYRCSQKERNILNNNQIDDERW